MSSWWSTICQISNPTSMTNNFRLAKRKVGSNTGTGTAAPGILWAGKSSGYSWLWAVLAYFLGRVFFLAGFFPEEKKLDFHNLHRNQKRGFGGEK